MADAPPDRLLPGTTIVGCSFKAARTNITFLHGVLQMVLVSLLGSANRATTLHQLRVKYGFRQPLLWHPLHMARPSESPLSHYTVNGVAFASS